MGTRHLYWILTGPSVAVYCILLSTNIYPPPMFSDRNIYADVTFTVLNKILLKKNCKQVNTNIFIITTIYQEGYFLNYFLSLLCET
jgi:hypothetical protein